GKAGARTRSLRPAPRPPLRVSPLRVDLRVGRHARLERAARVRHGDLHAIDEIDALLLRLHVLRRELGLRRDLTNDAGEPPTRERVYAERRRLAEPDPAEIRLRHVGAQPEVVRVHD